MNDKSAPCRASHAPRATQLAVRSMVCTVAAMATLAAAQATEQQVGVAGALDQKSAEKAFPAQRTLFALRERNIPTRPFFGDTHLHTSFSMDAGAFGARLDAAGRLRVRQGRGGHNRRAASP